MATNAIQRRADPGAARVQRTQQGVLNFGPGVSLSRTAFRVHDAISFDQWRECGQQLLEVAGAVQWWIGDWLNYGERTYGEKYTEALSATGSDYKTLANYAYVAQNVRFSRRRENLTFSVHSEVASLKPPDQTKILAQAERESLTVTAVRALVRALLHSAKLSTGPLLSGAFAVACADPPWAYDNSGFSQSAANEYPVLDDEALCALPTTDETFPTFAPESVLFLWATSPRLPSAHQVMAAWGFDYKACMVWIKNRAPGLGWWLQTRHELLLIGVRGSLLPLEKIDSVIEAAIRRHSQKPDEAYQAIERMFPGVRRVEIFARGKRAGWEPWGNEA